MPSERCYLLPLDKKSHQKFHRKLLHTSSGAKSRALHFLPHFFIKDKPSRTPSQTASLLQGEDKRGVQAFTGMAAHRVLSPLPGHCRIRSNLGLGTSGAGVRPVCQGACRGARAHTPCRRRRGCPACCPVALRSRPEAARTAGPCMPSSAAVAATLRTLTSPHQLLLTSRHPPSGAYQTINVLYVPQHEKVRDIP